MKQLLDTHLLLWAAGSPGHSSEEARAPLEVPGTELYFSAARLWEIASKQGLERADFQVDARLVRRGLLDNGYSELVIGREHAVAIDSLPSIHKDSFDRRLVALAMVEDVTLLTSDALVAQYPGRVRKV
jgi:PIN domain nuclease of toxin-antitoxin system